MSAQSADHRERPVAIDCVMAWNCSGLGSSSHLRLAGRLDTLAAGLRSIRPCSWARLNAARRAPTALLKAEADIPARFVLTLGAMNPVPSRRARAAQARHSAAATRRMSRASRPGQVVRTAFSAVSRRLFEFGASATSCQMRSR